MHFSCIYNKHINKIKDIDTVKIYYVFIVDFEKIDIFYIFTFSLS